MALDEAVALLKLFSVDRPTLSLRELARGISVPDSTAHRLVRVLVDAGFVAQAGKGAPYQLGTSALLLGSVAERTCGLGSVRESLEMIRELTEESVNLGIRSHDDVVILLRVQSHHPLRYEQVPGTKPPMHASAMGKTLLAFEKGSEEHIDSLVREGLEIFTHKTIGEAEGLRAECEVTRRRGYGVDEEESIVGIRCVAVPILDSDSDCGCVGAIAIQSPTVRYSSEELASFVPVLRGVADNVSGTVAALVGRNVGLRLLDIERS